MSAETGLPIDPNILIAVIGGLLLLIVLYYVLMIRALLEMFRLNAHTVLVVFTYLSVIPFPLFLILGIINLIIWRYYRRDLLMAQRAL